MTKANNASKAFVNIDENFDFRKFMFLDDYFNEPFLRAVFRQCLYRKSTRVPTAGVWYDFSRGRFVFEYNAAWFVSLKDDEKITQCSDPITRFQKYREMILDIFRHELYHITLGHISGERRPVDKSKWQLWNIACDLAINSYLENLPSKGCIPGEGPFKDWESRLSSEVYYERLMKAPPEQQSAKGSGGEGGEGDGETQEGSGLPQTMDDHDNWEGQSNKAQEPGEQSAARAEAKRVTQQAKNDALKGGRGWGSVSAGIQKEIEKFIECTIDWRMVLASIIKRSRRANKRSTVKRLNRRYPYIHAGRKITRNPKIAISIDQSGSVSDKLLSVFFGELNSLSRWASFTVIPFDHVVDGDKVYDWKQGTSKRVERVLCGGTNFDAPSDWVADNGPYDVHFILTDMGAPKPNKSRVERHWIVDSSAFDKPYFNPDRGERIIKVDMENW